MEAEGDEKVEVEEEFVDATRINIFSKVNLSEAVKRLVGSANWEQFSAPLLAKNVVKDRMELLERVLGRSSSQATSVANEVIKDMLNSTDYPPESIWNFS